MKNAIMLKNAMMAKFQKMKIVQMRTGRMQYAPTNTPKNEKPNEQ